MRVLLVDGQEEVRRGLRMRLEVEPDVEVIGETGRIGEALYLAQALAPDVIVADMGTRGDEEWILIERLRAVAPEAVLVALALRSDSGMRKRAQEAGVQAFLEKNGGGGDLLDVIRQVAGKATAERRPKNWNEIRTPASEIVEGITQDSGWMLKGEFGRGGHGQA